MPGSSQVYRDLTGLRRRAPELTDPDMRSTRCTVDEAARWFVMRRGSLVVVANFGEVEVEVAPGDEGYDVLWTTPSPADVTGGRIVLPPHGGAVLASLAVVTR